MYSIHCTNEVIKINKLTDDLIVASCANCGKIASAEKKDYTDEEWDDMVSDAKKHMNGDFSNLTTLEEK